MADLKINTLQASLWVKAVQTELADTKATLKEVQEIRNKMPGDGDTFLDFLESACKTMESVWTNTCTQFEKGWNALQEGLDAFEKAGKAIVDHFENLTIH